MNQAIQEGQYSLPTENFIGVWWSGSEMTLPVGAKSNGYKAWRSTMLVVTSPF